MPQPRIDMMKSATIVYASAMRKLITVLPLGFITLSFISTGEQYPSHTVQIEKEWFADQKSDNSVEGIHESSLSHNSDLLVRGKVKVKAFFKKFISIPRPEISTYVANDIASSLFFELLSFRPAYYSFLFRFTPF